MVLFVSLVILFFSIVALVLTLAVLIGMIRTGGIPFISTPKEKFDAILNAVDLKPGEKIYDLGCGKAHLLIRASKKYKAHGVGYELSLTPYLWARLKIWFSGADVEIKMSDFFKADLSGADVVFCYLFPWMMAKLEPKFQKELKKGARVVSYSFPLPNLEPNKVILSDSSNIRSGKIFVYNF